jgi:DNA-binding XRE family transcriptional regulator
MAPSAAIGGLECGRDWPMSGLGHRACSDMYGNPQRRTSAQVQVLRRQGGQWLKEQRERAGLSQRQLAQRLGIDFYTFISQLETGHGRIPPDRYLDWATALGLPPREFMLNLMRFYDPITYGILFPGSD